MKKILSLILSAILAATSFASCSVYPDKSISPSISVSSSDAEDSARWLTDRLGTLNEKVHLGVNDFDMSGFEDDGYIIRTEDEETVIVGKTQLALSNAVRSYAKYVQDGQAQGLDIVYHEGYRVKRLTVSENDISEYVILIPEDGDESVRFAASELSSFIKKACGVSLPTVTSTDSQRVIELIPVADTELGIEGFSTTVKDGRVTVKGGSLRGCLYGVYDILEDLIGYRFLTARETYLYSQDHVDIPEGYSNTELPALGYRCVYDHPVNYTYARGSFVDSSEYNARRKSNSLYANEARFGYSGIPNAHHGMSTYVKSVPDEKQPCLYDDDIFDEALENIMTYLDAENALGNIGTKVKKVDLGQNDNNGFCSCKNCREHLYKYASQAGCFLDFTNRMAEEISKVYPEIYVGMFAYWGAIIPPKNIEVHPNVLVCYVMYGFCQQHPLDGSECTNHTFQEGLNNSVHKRQLVEWQKLTPNVHVWFYTVDFWQGLSPFMNIDDYRQDFEYLSDTGILGVFCQNGQSQLSFDELNVYMESIVAWNPRITDEEFDSKVREFMMLFYGDGWESLYEYMMTACREKNFIACGKSDISAYIGANYDYIKALFEDASARCNTAEQEDRIERLSLHMHFQAVNGLYDEKYVNGTPEEREEIARIYTWVYDELHKYKIVRIGLEGRLLSTMPLDLDVPPLDWQSGKSGK